MHQSVNSIGSSLDNVLMSISALVIPAAYYSTQSGDSGVFTLKWAEALLKDPIN